MKKFSRRICYQVSDGVSSSSIDYVKCWVSGRGMGGRDSRSPVYTTINRRAVKNQSKSEGIPSLYYCRWRKEATQLRLSHQTFVSQYFVSVSISVSSCIQSLPQSFPSGFFCFYQCSLLFTHFLHLSLIRLQALFAHYYQV